MSEQEQYDKIAELERKVEKLEELNNELTKLFNELKNTIEVIQKAYFYL